MRLTAISHTSVAQSIPSSKLVSSHVVNNPSSRALLRIQPHTCSLRSTNQSQAHREWVGKCRSSAGDDAAPPPLSIEDASKVLGVSPTDGFETVLKAKNRMIAASDGNMEKLMQIEAAYDTILMGSMKRRLSGKSDVSTKVRYADVPATASRSKSVVVGRGGTAARGSTAQKVLLSRPGFPVAVAVPQQSEAVTQASVFSGLLVLSVIQALLEAPDIQLGETAGFELAVALGFSIYSLNKTKKMTIGKAAGITVFCLLAGAVVGTLVHSYIRFDIVPLGSFQAPGVFVTDVIIFFMGLGCVFLV